MSLDALFEMVSSKSMDLLSVLPVVVWVLPVPIYILTAYMNFNNTKGDKAQQAEFWINVSLLLVALGLFAYQYFVAQSTMANLAGLIGILFAFTLWQATLYLRTHKKNNPNNCKILGAAGVFMGLFVGSVLVASVPALGLLARETTML